MEASHAPVGIMSLRKYPFQAALQAQALVPHCLHMKSKMLSDDTVWPVVQSVMSLYVSNQRLPRPNL